MRTYVFDIDDTISTHVNRDYANAIPNNSVIRQIRRLKEIDKNCAIILHTARGMASCGGNARLAEAKNLPILIEWLSKHNVPYDEIVFGKPLADLYVDDKALNVRQFAGAEIERFEGLSGSEVMRIGDVVIKECADAQAQAKWYKECKSKGAPFGTPSVNSVTLNTLSMEYIAAPLLFDIAVANDGMPRAMVERIAKIIKWESSVTKPCRNDQTSYWDYCASKVNGMGIELHPVELPIFECGTFCAGDLSTLNVLADQDGIWIIDPVVREGQSSYLLDAAKFRACLHGLDFALTGRDYHRNGVARYFDSFFSQAELTEIRALEMTQFIRVLPYAIRSGDERIRARIIELINKNVWEE